MEATIKSKETHSIIIVPLNAESIPGKRDFMIWQQQPGDIDTFRMPMSAKVDDSVIFWWAQCGIVATGNVVGRVFKKEDLKDRNDGQAVAHVRFKKIFFDSPIRTHALAAAVRPVPYYIDEKLLAGTGLDNDQSEGVI